MRSRRVEQFNSLALVLKLKWIQQEQEDIPAEKDLLQRTTDEVITYAMSKTLNNYKLMDQIVTTVKMDFLDLAIT